MVTKLSSNIEMKDKRDKSVERSVAKSEKEETIEQLTKINYSYSALYLYTIHMYRNIYIYLYI